MVAFLSQDLVTSRPGSCSVRGQTGSRRIQTTKFTIRVRISSNSFDEKRKREINNFCFQYLTESAKVSADIGLVSADIGLVSVDVWI